MSDVLVRNVPGDVLERFKDLAASRGRSMQQELRRMIAREVGYPLQETPEAAKRISERFEAEGHTFSDSTGLIRADRDRRVQEVLRQSLQRRAGRSTISGAALARALREELRASGYAYRDGGALIREDRDR